MFGTRPPKPGPAVMPPRDFKVSEQPMYRVEPPRDPALRKAALDAVCAWERGDAAALAKAMEAVKGALVT